MAVAPHLRKLAERQAASAVTQSSDPPPDFVASTEQPTELPAGKKVEEPHLGTRPSQQSKIRDLVFYEGNYDVPLSNIKAILEPVGLWRRANSPLQHYGDVPEAALRAEVGRDRDANEIILSFIKASFIRRWSITLESSAFDTLRKLKAGCAPFPFAKLPGKVKKQVWAIWASWLTKEEPICINVELTQSYGRYLRHKHPLRKLCPTWCDKVLFGSNKFEFLVNCSGYCTPEDFSQGLQRLGHAKLKHLRHLRVDLPYGGKGNWETIIVTYDDENGLQGKACSTVDLDSEPYWPLDEHTEMITRRKKEENWDSTGVAEFFTTDPQALVVEFRGEDEYIEDDDFEYTERNERDAYQVAYGACYKDIRAVW